jgi:hypothetical protein
MAIIGNMKEDQEVFWIDHNNFIHGELAYQVVGEANRGRISGVHYWRHGDDVVKATILIEAGVADSRPPALNAKVNVMGIIGESSAASFDHCELCKVTKGHHLADCPNKTDRSRPQRTFTRFPNCAGRDGVDDLLLQELEAAGIPSVRFPQTRRSAGEVRTVITGVLERWSFRRALVNWVAEGPGLPIEEAEKLHASHGREVRVDGDCICPTPGERCKGFGIRLYHVDTQEGLKALADALKRVGE